MKVLLCAHAASEKWGGEAILPLHIFRGLKAKGHSVWLSVPAENRDELQTCLGHDFADVVFLSQSRLGEFIAKLANTIPRWFPRYLILFLGTLEASIRQRSCVKQLVKELAIDVVHVVTPVSPKLPSFIFRVGAPCIFGSMNGGMVSPPGLKSWEPLFARALRRLSKSTTGLLNLLMPGKRRADALIFANKRSYAALAFKASQKPFFLVENGLNESLWEKIDQNYSAMENAQRPFRYLFVGSLQLWKGSETFLRAFAQLPEVREPQRSRQPTVCTIVGPGEENRQKLLALAAELGVQDKTELPGFLPQMKCFELMKNADVFVFPSVLECGGAVVMEAMRAGLPVIAVNWGGPADYLNPDTGVLIEPKADPQELIAAVAAQMQRLLANESLRENLGAQAKHRAQQLFSWDSKIDAYLQIYEWAASKGTRKVDHPAIES